MSDDRKPIEAFLIEYSDSSFTNPHEAVLPDVPKDCRGAFTHMGAKYWGIESKRHKATSVLQGEDGFSYSHNAHNSFLIGLKQRAEIDTVTISTKWYTGNQVRAVSIYLKDEMTGQKKLVLERQPLSPDSEHSFSVPPTIATECLVECYYEGGISRVNLFGEPTKDQMPEQPNLLEGATVSHVSNIHYGQPDKAVNGVRKEMHMVGWESARTGFGERALFHLKNPATVDEIIVDTYLHRLNAPLACQMFALNETDESKIDELMKHAPRWKLVFSNGREVIPENFQDYMLNQKYLQEKDISDPTQFKIKLHVEKDSPWKQLLPFAPLTPDTYHRFSKLGNCGTVTHILYMHYPNGGIHGLKVRGKENTAAKKPGPGPKM
jgi:allantoicase